MMVLAMKQKVWSRRPTRSAVLRTAGRVFPLAYRRRNVSVPPINVTCRIFHFFAVFGASAAQLICASPVTAKPPNAQLTAENYCSAFF